MIGSHIVFVFLTDPRTFHQSTEIGLIMGKAALPHVNMPFDQKV